MEIITANSNPKIKNINKLNKNASFRKEEQVFIVEGIRMFRELPVDRVKQVFVSETGISEIWNRASGKRDHGTGQTTGCCIRQRIPIDVTDEDTAGTSCCR